MKKRSINKPFRPRTSQKKPYAQKTSAKKGPGSKRKVKTKKSGPMEPNRPTVKRLFAVSGNRCAFPGCKSSLIDEKSGSIIGQICHIKGENEGSKRYDKNQSREERQGFNNLILMCGLHHKIIDDDEKTYTVDQLVKMKKNHEAAQPKVAELTNEQADRLIGEISGNTLKGGSILLTQNQSGGQVAHTINYYQPPPQDDDLSIQGDFSIAGDTELLRVFGCPGLKLLVVNRGKRSAKIRTTALSLEDCNLIGRFQKGFGHDFGYTPPKDEAHRQEAVVLTMIPLSRPNRPEGYVLERDDVCSFYLPINPGLGIFREAPAEKMTVSATLFDNSEVELLRGEKIRDSIKCLIETYGRSAWTPNAEIQISLRVRSTTPPDFSFVGRTNPNPVSFVEPPSEQVGSTTQMRKVAAALGVVGSPTRECTLGIQVANTSAGMIDKLTVAFVVKGGKDLPFVETGGGPIPPGHQRGFVLPFQSFPDVKRLVGELPPDCHGFVIRSEKEELLRIPGEHVQQAVAYLEKLSQSQDGAPER